MSKCFKKFSKFFRRHTCPGLKHFRFFYCGNADYVLLSNSKIFLESRENYRNFLAIFDLKVPFWTQFTSKLTQSYILTCYLKFVSRRIRFCKRIQRYMTRALPMWYQRQSLHHTTLNFVLNDLSLVAGVHRFRMSNPSQYYQYGNYQYYPNAAPSYPWPNMSANVSNPYQASHPFYNQPFPPYPPQNYAEYKPVENLIQPPVPYYGPGKEVLKEPQRYQTTSGYFNHGSYPSNVGFKNCYAENKCPKMNSICPVESQSRYSDSSLNEYKVFERYQPAKAGEKEACPRLPSPDSFIKECQSGRKSHERLNQEEIIKNSIKQKSLASDDNKYRARESRKSKDSSHNRNGHSFVGVKKLPMKNGAREGSSKDFLYRRKRSKEFLRRWR